MPGAPEFDAAFKARLKDLFRWRRDVRQFRRDPLPKGMLDDLLETASLAPSVGLSEPWRFIIVEDLRLRAEIRTCFEDCNADALRDQTGSRAALYARLKLSGLDEAPSQLAVFADRTTLQGHGLGRRTMPETIEYSAVMAVHTLWLAARAEGVGMGWVSIIDPARVSTVLGAPDEWTFVAYLCLGYPIEEADTPSLQRDGWEHRREPGVIVKR